MEPNTDSNTERVRFITSFLNDDSARGSCESPNKVAEEELSFRSTPMSVVVAKFDEGKSSSQEKVCDICGVAGYRHLLALCSKCPDGAEHTYCMSIKLGALPGSDWMCEECVLSEEKRNHKTVRVFGHRKNPNLDVWDSIDENGRKSKCASHSSTKSFEGKLKSNRAKVDKDLSIRTLLISSKEHKKHTTANGVLKKSKSTNSKDSRMQFKVSEEVGSRKQDISEPPLSGSNKMEGVLIETSIKQKSTILSDQLRNVDIAEGPKTPSEPFQKEQNYTKKRGEIDLNHSTDEEYVCKKIKNVRSEDVKCSNGVMDETPNPSSALQKLPHVSSLTFVQSCESKLCSPEHKSTNLSHQLRNIETAADDQQLDRDMLPWAYPSQEREIYCKRIWELDLNCSPPDEEDSPKRMKNNEGVKDLQIGVPHGTCRHSVVASDTSIISADRSSTGGSMWLKFPQRPSYSNDTLESRVVNVECPMPIHGAVLQDHPSKLSSYTKNNDEDVDGPSALLSLSLALPSSSSWEQVIEDEPQTKLLLPEWQKYIGQCL
ncbi:hypothetical protein ACFE04_014983 [Oxalis oulophora]